MASYRFLQANLNHCAAAQDLLLQSLSQWLIDIAVIAEPYYVPPLETWVADLDGLVTIISLGSPHTQPLTVFARGKGYVAIQWRGAIVIGVYFSPNKCLAEFETFLDELRN